MFGTKIPPFSAFLVYRLPPTDCGREVPERKNRKDRILVSPVFLVTLVTLVTLVPPAPLFTGIFFDTCAVGAPKTRTSHRRRVSDRLVGRG